MSISHSGVWGGDNKECASKRGIRDTRRLRSLRTPFIASWHSPSRHRSLSCFCLFLLNTGCHITQAGLELLSLLPPSFTCWGYRCILLFLGHEMSSWSFTWLMELSWSSLLSVVSWGLSQYLTWGCSTVTKWCNNSLTKMVLIPEEKDDGKDIYHSLHIFSNEAHYWYVYMCIYISIYSLFIYFLYSRGLWITTENECEGWTNL